MPTYEYICASCPHEWEFEQSIKEDPIKECPSCHQQTARRQISRGTGFILKGGGWYSDLYSSSGNKAPSSSSSSTSSSSGGGSSSSESKPSTSESKSSTSETKSSDASPAV